MKFCSSCGAKIPDGSKFCTECGNPVPISNGSATVLQTPAEKKEKHVASQEQTVMEKASAQERHAGHAEPEAPGQQSYTPPEQQSYTPPEQQSYTPPGQQSYTPPGQQSYTPSGQQSYTQQEYAQTVNRKGLKGGKTGRKPLIIGAVVLLLMIVLVAKGCASGSGEKQVADKDSYQKESAASGKTSPGAVAADVAKKTDGALSEAKTKSTEKVEQNSMSAIQQKWNGTWYGLLHVIDAEGLENISSGDNFDAYMVVNVDADGKGTFGVYLFDEFDGPYVSAECEAKENSLSAVSGEAFETEMNTYNWMFLPMPDFPDQYSMGDTISDGDYTMDFTMFMKKWGADWQSEANAGNLVPPGVNEYVTKIRAGELPPIGEAPYEYEGAAMESMQESTIPATQKNAETVRETQMDSDEDYGKSNADATGISTLQAMQNLYKICYESRSNGYHVFTYEEARDMLGSDGIVWKKTSVSWNETKHTYRWVTEDGSEYFNISFELEDGEEWYNSCNFSENVKNNLW